MSVNLHPDGAIDAYLDGSRSTRAAPTGTRPPVFQRVRQRLLWVPAARTHPFPPGVAHPPFLSPAARARSLYCTMLSSRALTMYVHPCLPPRNLPASSSTLRVRFEQGTPGYSFYASDLSLYDFVATPALAADWATGASGNCPLYPNPFPSLPACWAPSHAFFTTNATAPGAVASAAAAPPPPPLGTALTVPDTGALGLGGFATLSPGSESLSGRFDGRQLVLGGQAAGAFATLTAGNGAAPECLPVHPAQGFRGNQSSRSFLTRAPPQNSTGFSDVTTATGSGLTVAFQAFVSAASGAFDGAGARLSAYAPVLSLQFGGDANNQARIRQIWAHSGHSRALAISPTHDSGRAR